MLPYLHVHSSYSFLRGLASPVELARAAAQDGLPALALTDTHSLTGAVEFVDACREVGVQPLLGLEVAVQPPEPLSTVPPQDKSCQDLSWQDLSWGVLVLLAQDLSGWGNLCRVASFLIGEADRLPFDRLAQHSGGLICLTGGGRGSLARLALAGQKRQAQLWLGALQEIFPSRLYVELNLHTSRDKSWVETLAALAGEVPLAATQDIHYLLASQGRLQRVVTAARLNRPLASLDASTQDLSYAASEAAPPGSHWLSPAELAQRFSAWPAALQNAAELPSRIHLELPLGQPHYPEVTLPQGETVMSVLARKAQAGARRLYGQESPAVQARLAHELEVIEQTGYAALFLIVEDILAYARQQGIPIASRGSASSSLVAHCLGITTPDPVRLNLYFERFLNPARHTPPDIDTDLCSRRRDEVLHYVVERFGQERVAMVCTINRFRHRSALREVAKAYGLPSEQISLLADSLPHRWYGPSRGDYDEEVPYAELREQFPELVKTPLFEDAAALIGLPRHLSVHPGGMVISPGALHDLVPTQMAPKGMPITQFDLDSIERLGLVKIDLLGIRGLSVLGDVGAAAALSVNAVARTEKRVHPKDGIDFLERIPEDDPQVSEWLENGRTIGCFQIESPGMRATLREIHARTVDDLMVALALYRPGPLTGGLKDAFVRRHLGQESADDLHPALQPLLADTYGVILYQEQVLRIAHELAGLSLADADLLRRAMSHFDPGKQMQNLQEKFIAGALERSQVPPEIALRVWDLMAAFAGYGFPKAHAASYAQLGWRLAWCKTYFPAEFMTAVLANWGGYYSQRVYLTEARRLGLAVRPPHVNYAGREFTLSDLEGQPVLFMGLDQVRDLTRRTIARILKDRPFRSFPDFLARADPRPAEAENLVKVGACEGFGSIPALLVQLSTRGWKGGQLSLFPHEPVSEPEWPLEQMVVAQEEILGLGVTAHPLELAAAALATAGALNTLEAASRLGQRVRVAGMRQTWRRTPTSRGDYIYFMALEDLEGVLDVVIFGEVYRRNQKAFATPGPYLLEGVIEQDRRQGDPFLRLERAWPPPWTPGLVRG